MGFYELHIITHTQVLAYPHFYSGAGSRVYVRGRCAQPGTQRGRAMSMGRCAGWGFGCVAAFFVALVYDHTRCSCLTGARDWDMSPFLLQAVPTIVGPPFGIRTSCCHEAAVPSPMNAKSSQFGDLALTTSTYLWP